MADSNVDQWLSAQAAAPPEDGGSNVDQWLNQMATTGEPHSAAYAAGAHFQSNFHEQHAAAAKQGQTLPDDPADAEYGAYADQQADAYAKQLSQQFPTIPADNLPKLRDEYRQHLWGTLRSQKIASMVNNPSATPMEYLMAGANKIPFVGTGVGLEQARELKVASDRLTEGKAGVLDYQRIAQAMRDQARQKNQSTGEYLQETALELPAQAAEWMALAGPANWAAEGATKWMAQGALKKAAMLGVAATARTLMRPDKLAEGTLARMTPLTKLDEQTGQVQQEPGQGLGPALGRAAISEEAGNVAFESTGLLNPKIGFTPGKIGFSTAKALAGVQAAKEIPYWLGAGGTGGVASQLANAKGPEERIEILKRFGGEAGIFGVLETVMHGAGTKIEREQRYKEALDSRLAELGDPDAARLDRRLADLVTLPDEKVAATLAAEERKLADATQAAHAGADRLPTHLDQASLRPQIDPALSAGDARGVLAHAPERDSGQVAAGDAEGAAAGAVPAAAGNGVGPSAEPTARQQVEALEAEHLKVLGQMHDAQRSFAVAKSEAAMGFPRAAQIAAAANTKKAAQKRLAALARQLDPLRIRAAAEEPAPPEATSENAPPAPATLPEETPSEPAPEKPQTILQWVQAHGGIKKQTAKNLGWDVERMSHKDTGLQDIFLGRETNNRGKLSAGRRDPAELAEELIQQGHLREDPNEHTHVTLMNAILDHATLWDSAAEKQLAAEEQEYYRERQEAIRSGDSLPDAEEALRAGQADGQADEVPEAIDEHAASLGLAPDTSFDFGANEPGPAPVTNPHDKLVQAALERYANRDQTAKGGGLFGGEDMQAREGFAALRDGTPIVFTNGEFKGQTGKIQKNGERIVATLDGRDGAVPISPEGIEPLSRAVSWRTDTARPRQTQQTMIGAMQLLKPREEPPASMGGAVPGPASTGDHLLSLASKIKPRFADGAMIGLPDLRQEAGMSKADFDKAILDLAKQGRVDLHRHTHPGSLEPGDKEAMVQGDGQNFIGMVARDQPNSMGGAAPGAPPYGPPPGMGVGKVAMPTPQEAATPQGQFSWWQKIGHSLERLGQSQLPATRRVSPQMADSLAAHGNAEPAASKGMRYFSRLIKVSMPHPTDPNAFVEVPLGDLTPEQQVWVGTTVSELRHRHAKANGSAPDAVSFVGGEGSPLATEADFEHSVDRLWSFREGYTGGGFASEVEGNYRGLKNLAPDQETNTPTQIPGFPIHELGLNEEAKGPGVVRARQADLANLRVRKPGLLRQASLDSAAYDTNILHMMEAHLRDSWRTRTKVEAIRAGLADGAIKDARQGGDVAGYTKIPFDVESGLGLDPKADYRVRSDLYHELIDALGIGERPGENIGQAIGKVTNPLYELALGGTVELLNHNANMLTALPELKGTVPGALARVIKEAVALAKADPEALRLDWENAKIGASFEHAARGGMTGSLGLGELAGGKVGKADPTMWAGKLTSGEIDLMQRATRNQLGKTYDALVAEGTKPPGAASKRDFINKAMGNYSSRVQSRLIQFLRDSGLDRFSTAGFTFTAQSMRRVGAPLGLGVPTVPNTSVRAGLAGRAAMIAKLAPFLALGPVLNALRYGQPFPDNVPAFAVKTGEDDDKVRYFDPAFFLRRGWKMTGVEAAGDALHGKMTGGEFADQAARQAGHGALRMVAGPPVQLGAIAATGETLEGHRAAAKVSTAATPTGQANAQKKGLPPKGSSQEWENVKAAGKAANPIGASLSDQKQSWYQAFMHQLGPLGEREKRKIGQPLKRR